MRVYLKSIVALFAALTALLLCCASVSADDVFDYPDPPDYHNYPNTVDGYTSFILDYYKFFSVSEDVFVWNTVFYTADDIKRYFTGEGIDTSSFKDPRSVFSNYYMNGGDTQGNYDGGNSYWNDGHGGSFKVVREPTQIVVYYYSNSGERSVVYKLGGSNVSKQSLTITGVSTTDQPNVVIVHIYSAAIGGAKDVRFTLPYNWDGYEVQERGPVRGKLDGLGVSLRQNSDGSVSLVDDDGNEYHFNPDGTVTVNGDDWYFEPDFTTLTDDSIDDIVDAMNNWALMMNVTINNITQSGCSCKDYSDILSYIANQCYKINSNTTKINRNVSAIKEDTEAINENTEHISENTDELVSLLTKLVEGCETEEEKENYFTEVSGILLALSNVLPYESIKGGISVVEEFIFKGNSPQSVTVTVLGHSCTVLDSGLLSTFAAPIATVRNILGFIVLYLWLLKMREKVTSI